MLVRYGGVTKYIYTGRHDSSPIFLPLSLDFHVFACCRQFQYQHSRPVINS